MYHFSASPLGLWVIVFIINRIWSTHFFSVFLILYSPISLWYRLQVVAVFFQESSVYPIRKVNLDVCIKVKHTHTNTLNFTWSYSFFFFFSRVSHKHTKPHSSLSWDLKMHLIWRRYPSKRLCLWVCTSLCFDKFHICLSVSGGMWAFHHFVGIYTSCCNVFTVKKIWHIRV